MRYVILGCGPAGAFTAKDLRALLPDAQITLLDESEKGLYARMRLPEFLCGTLPEEKLILSGPAAFEKLSIQCCFGKRAVSIDRADKKVLLDDGSAIAYDTLILAAGADAAVPAVEGLEKCSSYYVLRSLEDAKKIRERCFCGSLPHGALVIGGGLLGLEAAASLLKCSVKSSVAEFAHRLLPKNLNEKESALLLEKVKGMGMELYLNASLSSVRECADGSTECVFADGRVIQCSLLLFSTGIRPRTGLAAGCGLEIGRGIRVDHFLRTSDSHIYAAGDCAELNGQIPGLWLAARDQAKALARILAGQSDTFEMPSYKPELKISGISLKEICASAGV